LPSKGDWQIVGPAWNNHGAAGVYRMQVPLSSTTTEKTQ
jgi:hypothetical protein